MAMSKSTGYKTNIFCAEYDLLGVYEAFGADFIINLTMKFAQATDQSPEFLRALAKAEIKAHRSPISNLTKPQQRKLTKPALPLNTIGNVNAQLYRQQDEARKMRRIAR